LITHRDGYVECIIPFDEANRKLGAVSSRTGSRMISKSQEATVTALPSREAV
jgi:hypothetical protein